MRQHPIEELRSLLHQAPSHSTWHQLLDWTERWSEHEELEWMYTYLLQHLESWPNALRNVPESWKERWLHTSDLAQAPLFRSLQLSSHLLRAARSYNPDIESLLQSGNLRNITKLNVSNALLRNTHIEALTQSQQIEQIRDLTLDENLLREEAIQTLLTAPQWSQLQKLSLRKSALNDKEALCLSRLGHPSIEVLHLDHNRIESRGLRSLLLSMSWPSLHTLSVQNNAFGSHPYQERELYDLGAPFDESFNLDLQHIQCNGNPLNDAQGKALLKHCCSSLMQSLCIAQHTFTPATQSEYILYWSQEPSITLLDMRSMSHPILPEYASILLHAMSPKRRCFFSWPIHHEVESLLELQSDIEPTDLEPIYCTRFGAKTRKGYTSQIQEDAYSYAVSKHRGIVVDGMGYHDGGAVFSQLFAAGLCQPCSSSEDSGQLNTFVISPMDTMEYVEDWIEESRQISPFEQFDSTALSLFEQLGHWIAYLSELQEYEEGIQSSHAHIAACQVVGKYVLLAHQGNTQIYRFREKRLECIVQASLSDAASIHMTIPDNLYAHSTVETQEYGIGSDSIKSFDCVLLPACQGDIYIMCTKGIHQVLSDTKLEQLLSTSYLNAMEGRKVGEREPLEWMARKILEAATQQNGDSDGTVLLMSIEHD